MEIVISIIKNVVFSLGGDVAKYVILKSSQKCIQLIFYGGRKMVKKKIIEKVLKERKRQNKKWGEQNHTAPAWGMIIGEEYGEMCQAINEFGFNPTPETEEQIYTEAIHTMASCMAMIECIERHRSKM